MKRTGNILDVFEAKTLLVLAGLSVAAFALAACDDTAQNGGVPPADAPADDGGQPPEPPAD